MKKWVLLAVVVLVLVAVFWTANYNATLSREWSGLQQALAELDTSISGTNCDFADIEKSANDLKSRVDLLRTRIAASVAPPWFTRKKFYFVDYLEKTSATLALISTNCKVWSGAEMGRMTQAAQTMRDAQTTCSVVLGLPASRTDIFVATASTFNKMRQARKKASQPTAIATLPTSSGFVTPSDSYLANYISQMQSLLREYKGLRTSLDRFINYVKTSGALPPGSDICSALEGAKNARISIRNRMQMQPIPAGWESRHAQAVQCVQNGIDAIEALQSGDYLTFHQISEANTSILSRVRSVYGY